MRRLMLASLIVCATTTGCIIVDPSCGSSGASVYVSPTVVVIAVGQTATPIASERGCDGRYHGHSSPRWSLVNAADSTFISLNVTTGEITGRRSGKATVEARSMESGSTATVAVTVH